MNAMQFAQDGVGMHERWGDRGFHPIMALLCVIAIGAAIALVVWLIVGRRSHLHAAAPSAAPMAQVAPSPTASAETILAERLARSEIGPDDYRSMIAALREQPPSA